MLCCVQDGETALYWAARGGYANIVQSLVDHGAAVDLGRDEVTNHDYLLNCGWSFGCGFIVNVVLISCMIIDCHSGVNESCQTMLYDIRAWLST